MRHSWFASQLLESNCNEELSYLPGSGFGPLPGVGGYDFHMGAHLNHKKCTFFFFFQPSPSVSESHLMFMINYDEIMVLNGCVKLATMKGTEQPFSTLSEEQLHTALHHFSVSEFQLKGVLLILHFDTDNNCLKTDLTEPPFFRLHINFYFDYPCFYLGLKGWTANTATKKCYKLSKKCAKKPCSFSDAKKACKDEDKKKFKKEKIVRERKNRNG